MAVVVLVGLDDKIGGQGGFDRGDGEAPDPDIEEILSIQDYIHIRFIFTYIKDIIVTQFQKSNSEVCSYDFTCQYVLR